MIWTEFAADGTAYIYEAYSKEVLLAKSTDGGQSFSAPVEVTRYYGLPDCLTYQGSDPFRSCVPEHSKEPGCTPTGFNPSTGQPLDNGTKPGPCNNDILLSVSNDGGAIFSGGATGVDPRTETTVNQDPDQANSDQWCQWRLRRCRSAPAAACRCSRRRSTSTR